MSDTQEIHRIGPTTHRVAVNHRDQWVASKYPRNLTRVVRGKVDGRTVWYAVKLAEVRDGE